MSGACREGFGWTGLLEVDSKACEVQVPHDRKGLLKLRVRGYTILDL